MSTATTASHDLAPPSDERDPAKDARARRIRLQPWGTAVGPIHRMAAERERLAGLRFSYFDVHSMSPTIGAEVRGIEVGGDLPEAVINELRDCLLQFKVIFFRNQHISSGDHVRFAERFGKLEIHPFIPANTEHPELVRFAKDAEIGGYENGWHSDVTWRKEPSMGAILRAVEVPEMGGDTLFCDMYAAHDGLEPETQERIASLKALHDYVKVFGKSIPEEKRQELREAYPAVEHPVVRTHPETGRRLLYVNRFFVRHIVGMEKPESDALLDELCREADTVEYQCRFHWERDSIAFWDNRAVQHYACSDYWPQRRVMERASVVGDRPR